MSPDPWVRHRALALVREAWPELAGSRPPPREQLADALARAGVGWTLAPANAGHYESLVVEGRIPTRDDSWHDTFNLLAFMTFPRSKAALHRRGLSLQRGREVGSRRSREEDALALIDETALVFAGPAAALEQFDVARELGDLDQLDAIVRAHGLSVYVFGHALLEHLAFDRPQIGAGVLTLALDAPLTRARIDATLAERIDAAAFPRPGLSPTLPWPEPRVEAWLGSPAAE